MIYCRSWDYARGCRHVILLLLQTGVFKTLILHICHSYIGADYRLLTRQSLARVKMCQEIQFHISRLGLDTMFVLETEGELHRFVDGKVMLNPFCTFDQEMFMGLFCTILPNGTPCLCCCLGCYTIPSQRLSVAIVHPDTLQVDYKWIFPMNIVDSEYRPCKM
jgi:hypothetical protein